MGVLPPSSLDTKLCCAVAASATAATERYLGALALFDAAAVLEDAEPKNGMVEEVRGPDVSATQVAFYAAVSKGDGSH